MLIINISCGSKHLLFWARLILLANVGSCLPFELGAYFVSVSH